jgi:SagB-type dehydrogenase family enzyme
VKKATHLALVITISVLLVAGTSVGCASEGADDTAGESAVVGSQENAGAGADQSASNNAQSDISSTSRGHAADDNQTIVLPTPQLKGSVSLEEAIEGRRSVRDYTDEPLSLEELSQLLWAMQGITSPHGGRAAPSAGGTYPLEIFVVSGAVTAVPPGVYRYRPASHDLAPIVAGDVRASLQAASLDQQWVGKAPLDIVVAAVYERTMERYGERGVRYVLQAVGLGLGAVTVGAFHDEDVKALLHMTSEEEPLYVIPVGQPASP